MALVVHGGILSDVDGEGRLAIDGRAAMMISSSFCRPLVMRSSSVKSVAGQ